MTCFYQSRGEHRDVNAKNVVISGVESKDLGLPSSVQANDTDSGISQLEYGSQAPFANRAESKGTFSTVDTSFV
ncbi:hypothetical protein CY35_04G015000 [Sphagnum magellanicum]|nr:hypothetical protein CY35_04G015000 [Sphagnum magellanicum]